MELQRKHGNQWARITKFLPGRTDSAVKNRFHQVSRANARQQLEEDSLNKEQHQIVPCDAADLDDASVISASSFDHSPSPSSKHTFSPGSSACVTEQQASSQRDPVPTLLEPPSSCTLAPSSSNSRLSMLIQALAAGVVLPPFSHHYYPSAVSAPFHVGVPSGMFSLCTMIPETQWGFHSSALPIQDSSMLQSRPLGILSHETSQCTPQYMESSATCWRPDAQQGKGITNVRMGAQTGLQVPSTESMLSIATEDLERRAAIIRSNHPSKRHKQMAAKHLLELLDPYLVPSSAVS
jgi:hypothetical protein